MSERDAVIVGAGPAGMAAAKELVNRGVRVTLIEEMPEPGGQYYRQHRAAADVRRGPELDERADEATAALQTLAGETLTVRSGTLAWGLFPGNQLALLDGDRVELLHADAIVLATGAIERSAAFPGWTLPGVMTAGGLQALLSREAILAGRRVVVAGSGPLLLAVAVEINEAGGQVVAVVEGTAASAPLGHIHHFLRQMRRVRQGLDYRRTLAQQGTSVLTGHTVVAARGEGQVAEVVVAPVDREWQRATGPETTFSADSLCLHYGFVASTELARMAECELAYAVERGGWYVVHDEGMRTSQPGIYVAGQSAGIGGSDLAAATGRLAGMTVAQDLGATARGDAAAVSSVRREIERAREFATVLNTVYAVRPAVADLISPETTVCRCEEVTAAEVEVALREGARTIDDIKRRTRCGMGRCQGRICTPVLTSLLDRRAGVSPLEAGLITARPPVKPIPLAALASLAEVEQETASHD